MSVYSMDLRRKIIDVLHQGETVASVARRFDVDQKTVRSYRKRAMDGRLEPDRSGVKGHTKLTHADLRTLRDQVAANPDITLRELQSQLSVQVALSTVHRALRSLGLSFKKKSLIACEQRRPDVVEKRLHFRIAQRFVSPDSFVFLDESGAQSNMTRMYGRAPVGARCNDHTPHGHWKTTTLLSAIRSEGVIESATVIIDRAVDAISFLSYVEQFLAPSLRAGDVVVMDNLSSHKVTGVVEAIEAVNASVWFLPPYSPDMNPIEKLWSKVKSWLRRVRPSDFDTIGRALVDVLRTVTPTECENYFRSCGYGI